MNLERELRTFQLIVRLLLGLSLAVNLPEPSNAEEFSDTVTLGPVEMSYKLSPIDPTIGDIVRFELEVTAEEDVEVLMPEFGDVISGFPITQFIPKQRIDASGRMIQSVVYEFQVVYSGEQTIQPIGIEFIDHRAGQKPAPEDYDAYELETQRIDFEVASVTPRAASDELQPPLPALELPSEKSTASYLIWALLAICVVALPLVWFIWRGRRQQVLKASAYEIARKRLDRLLQEQRSGSGLSGERFFVEISSVVRQYLEHRFELKAPELTTDEFLQLASQESDLSRQHQALLREFLSQADLVKFAGVSASDADIERSSGLALQFLEETRLNAPEVVLEDTSKRSNRSGKEETPARQESQHV